MNKTKYLQTDSRWSELGYPKSPCTIGNSGCGEVSIVNCIIEMQKYAKYTPKTIQSYCKQYATASCDGTLWSGIPKMMKNYGLTEVKQHDDMSTLWKELEKGDRVAIYLMGSRKGGTKKVHWTSGGHFVCSVAYKHEDGKHKVYVKDSYSNSKDRNGWISYEENMQGDVSAVWSGKLTGKLYDGKETAEVKSVTTTSSSKLTVDGIGGKATIKAMQKFLGTTQDGIISGQNKNYAPLYPAITAIEFGKGGSNTVKALQKWLGLPQDGIIGKKTTKAWQKALVNYGYLAKNETIDGIIGVKSMKAWQEFLNSGGKKKSSTTKKATTTKKSTTYKVIDVSEWQGNIDWKKVKADGIVGAIIRYADGDYVDKNFDKNMKNAKANGLHVGAYIFSRAKTKAQAEKEAKRLYDACKKYKPDMPLYIDLEDNSLSKYADTVALAFIAKIKALGGNPGVYANLSWWNNHLIKTAKTKPIMWLAQYNDKMTYKDSSAVGMWQYSSKGKVKGISGNVDMDTCYKAYWKE